MSLGRCLRETFSGVSTAWLLLLAALVPLRSALGADITIEPGAYKGTYIVFLDANKLTDRVSGPKTLPLIAGDKYRVHISHGVDFPFRIQSTQATCPQVAGLECAGQTITFQTAPVIIDSGVYGARGRFFVSGVENGVPNPYNPVRTASTR